MHGGVICGGGAAVLAGLAAAYRNFDRSSLPLEYRHVRLELVASADLWRAAADVARHLRSDHPECYGLFNDDEEVLKEILAQLEDPAGPAQACEDCRTRLARLAEGAWVVGTSICNLKPPDGLVWLSEDRVLAPAADGVIGRDDAYQPERRAALEAAREIEARLGRAPAAKWRYTLDEADAPVDRRRTVQYVARGTGTPRAVRERLAVETRFVVASWCVLSPPRAADDIAPPLWPIATEFQPQPWLHAYPRVHRVGGEDKKAADIASSGMSYGRDSGQMHPLPDGWQLRAPTVACALATTSHAASALLSASWALYRAARVPTDSTWLDRLALMMQAREALCEPWRGRREQGTSRARWSGLRLNAGLDAEMKRLGWEHFDVDSIAERSWELRNMAMHGGDFARLALGQPMGTVRRTRRGEVPSTDLTPIQVREQLEPTYGAVLHAVQWSWRTMQAVGFDDERFDELFRGA